MNKLIDSILNQTSRDFEWIIIDDCSMPDEHLMLEKKLVSLGIDYKLFTNDVNSGPGVSRNIGIKLASGDYVTFVDSDDYIPFNFVDKINHYFKNDIDFFTFDYYKVYDDKISYASMVSNHSFGNIEIEELMKRTLLCAWGGVYLTRIIINNNISFPKMKRYEDFVFKVKYLCNCKRAYHLNEGLYFYVQHDESLSHSKEKATIYSEQALELVKKDLVFDKSIFELLFVREVIYLKIKEDIFLKKFKNSIKKYDEVFPNWNRRRNTHFLDRKQKLILFLYKIRAYFLIKILIRMNS